jgi:hypothetical protein
MKRLALVLVVVGGLGALGVSASRLARAEDPVAVTQEEKDRIKQLVDNLGSDDFRVREGATKELTEFGEKARTALGEAQKHESAEVRFRAEQILRRLDGRSGERKFDDRAAPGGTPGTRSGGERTGPWWGPFGDREGHWGENLQKRVRELEEQMRRAFQGGDWHSFGEDWLPGGVFGRALRVKNDHAEYVERPGAARLTIVEVDASGAKSKHAYDGKDLDAILAAHPALKEKPGVADLVAEVAKAREERAAKPDRPFARWFGGLAPGQPEFSFSSKSSGVQIEQTPGHVKVTVTETGPDGKPATKTYEGTDLEALKAQHPELKDKLGGVRLKVHVGPGSDEPFGDLGERDEWKKAFEGWKRLGPGGLLPPEVDEDGAGLGTQTGPFGLQIAPVDEPLRAQLGLEAGVGVLVRVVRPDSPAARLGLQAHDVIRTINGDKVGTTEQVRAALRAVAADAPVSIDLVRGGKPVRLTR